VTPAPGRTTPDAPPPPAWVYILRCADGSLYTGWSSDLERRLASHEAGRASRYTASRLPVELALALPMEGRSAAMSAEARIKRLSRAEKLELLAQGRRGHGAPAVPDRRVAPRAQ
jgi:putative endonuclease